MRLFRILFGIFEQKLRVFLRKTEQNIADTENFTLDNLELYQIKEELIYLSEQEWGRLSRMKIKGNYATRGVCKSYRKNEEIRINYAVFSCIFGSKYRNKFLLI